MEGEQRRGALRICSAYRTVSAVAAQVIAGVIPIDLLAEERQRIYHRKGESQPARVKAEERGVTVQKWQDRWRTESRGRWTARLIHDVEVWTGRKQGETNYYLTQFLTGHGYFRAYLRKIGKVMQAECLYCGLGDDDAHHTFFVCPQWQQARSSLTAEVGDVEPETIVVKMLESKEKWDAVHTFVTAVLKTKERDRGWEGLDTGQQLPPPLSPHSAV